MHPQMRRHDAPHSSSVDELYGMEDFLPSPLEVSGSSSGQQITPKVSIYEGKGEHEIGCRLKVVARAYHFYFSRRYDCCLSMG